MVAPVKFKEIKAVTGGSKTSRTNAGGNAPPSHRCFQDQSQAERQRDGQAQQEALGREILEGQPGQQQREQDHAGQHGRQGRQRRQLAGQRISRTECQHQRRQHADQFDRDQSTPGPSG